MEHLYATALKVMVNKLAQLRMATTLRDPMRSRIGMFHAVVADDAPLPDEYACHISELRAIIEEHQKNGFRFVTLRELLSLPAEKAGRGLCVLTFDDGFIGLHTLAAPCLAALAVPYAVYITTGYLDTEGYLTTDMLVQLAGSPLCTVGSHLVTHPMTRFLSAEAALSEMIESKRTLESILDKPVPDLAFPYGSAYACSLRDVRLAARAGYETALLTTPTVFVARRPYRNHTLPRLHMLRT